MKLTVLADNSTFIDMYYLGEPAVSYYIEDGGTKILFDTGYSDVYLRNAEALGISLEDLDAVVISHGHNDHTGGLRWFPETGKKIRLTAHPDAFEEKRHEGLAVGSFLTKEELGDRFELVLSREPLKISPSLTFLGEIPRVTSFEGKPVGKRYVKGCWQSDRVLDDSAIVFEKEDGIYIVTGCSHAGICNIILRARELFGGKRVKGLIGGFHLFDAKSEQMKQTALFLEKEGIDFLYPCHCTSLAARCALDRLMPINEAGVGLKLEW